MMMVTCNSLLSQLTLIVIALDSSHLFNQINTDFRLIDGQHSRPGQFPWMVKIELTSLFDLKKTEHVCGGAIIHEKWIISAGHCFYLSQDLEMFGLWRKEDHYVLVNESKAHLNKVPEWHPIQAIIRHPKFSVKLEGFCPTAHYDVVLLHLRKPLKLDGKFVDTIKLASQFKLKSGDLMTISGYGLTEYGHTRYLRYTDLIYIDPVECNAVYEGILGTDHICANWTKGWRSVFYGDSGSPIVANGQLYGLTAFMCPDIAKSNPRPSVFTNITYFYDWIKEQVEKAGDRLLF